MQWVCSFWRVKKLQKINAVQLLKLRDVIEDVNGNPRAGDTMEMIKKELKKMKVVENREEPFKKGILFKRWQ